MRRAFFHSAFAAVVLSILFLAALSGRAQPAAAGSASNVGGLNNLDEYCSSIGYDHAAVSGGYWYCTIGGSYTSQHGNDTLGSSYQLINFDNACSWQYPQYSRVYGRHRDTSNPFTWYCEADLGS